MIYDTAEQAFAHAMGLMEKESEPVWIVEFIFGGGFSVVFDLNFYPPRSFRRVAKIMPKKGGK